MKETTKYNSYRFVGTIKIDEIMPWFDFDKGKPWDQKEVPWVLENKVRREILLSLAHLGPLDIDEIYKQINFSPNPLMVNPDEYKTSVKYQWDKEVIQNHLLNLEWYGLIQSDGQKYRVTFPVLTSNNLINIERYTIRLAHHWIEIIRKMKLELEEEGIKYDILIEKTIDQLYSLLKEEEMLPNTPNIKSLWAEQLREIKFEKWVKMNF
ncbi:MAG: hypothetical protein KGD73_13655 [Candidatus Lokiarchaeota archaeon]|nr:hypothetical protein [Candidatus Lokiarchaeota archaeon]